MNGRYITIFPKQAIGLREFKKTGKLRLSQTDIYIPTKLTDFTSLKEVRIVPRTHHYVIEVVYQVKEKTHYDNGKYASIDLGLNNLATVAFNDGSKPLIVNGRPLNPSTNITTRRRLNTNQDLKEVNEQVNVYVH